MRRTKIIVSIGPATYEREIILEAAKAGMDIARNNMSHQDHAWHSRAIDRVRDVAAEMGKEIPIEMDLQGPSVRTGDILTGGDEKGFLHIKRGDSLILTTDSTNFSGRVFVNYPQLLEMVDVGSKIFIDDAFVQLQVTKKEGKDIHCVSLHDTKLGSRRTIHIPGKSFDIPLMREKDWKDLQFGIDKEVDFVGLSFVRTAEDVKKVRDFIKGNKSKAKIIAKIETPEAIQNIDGIIKEADAILVARGDMGVMLPLEKVPFYHHMILKKCKEAGRFVITATEMMESMKNRRLPTRAEVTDVFNAVLLGSDALLLSGETAEGNFPIETIDFMRRTIEAAESSPHRLIISD